MQFGVFSSGTISPGMFENKYFVNSCRVTYPEILRYKNRPIANKLLYNELLGFNNQPVR